MRRRFISVSHEAAKSRRFFLFDDFLRGFATSRETKKPGVSPLRSLRRAIAAVCLLTFAAPAFALGPHEVALVVNDESFDSVLLGLSYKRLRNIPDANMIRLSVPESAYNGTDISPENFTRYIWEPLTSELQKRGISRQVLACVYACGFPTRVRIAPDEGAVRPNGTPMTADDVSVSLTGMTFLRNTLPPKDKIVSGEYFSPLFAGPVLNQETNEISAPGNPATFDVMRNLLLENMPFPAMMLAYTGARGITLDDALANLERTAAADHTAPEGTFYFAVNSDVRSTTRQWEYAGAAERIRAFAGQTAVISTNLPPAGTRLAGFMTGARTVDTAALDLLPGAYADHLTSFGGVFDKAEHTKATQWLRDGAAFSSGTVTEPYAIWQKFASACIFAHSLAGASAIESFYAATCSPLQILAIGDPLSKPWAPRLEPVIHADTAENLSGTATFEAAVRAEDPKTGYLFSWLVDGKLAASGRTFLWNTKNASNGPHTIRLVVRRQDGALRHQNFATLGVTVNNPPTHETVVTLR